MRPTVRRLWLLMAVVILATAMSGCIVCPWSWDCDRYPPRMAQIHVYALDYYTGMPITWASVDLEEADWWSWNYIGTWTVNGAGYTPVFGGYLYYHGNGGPEDRVFRVTVYASGYQSESYTLELDYNYPSESLYFYIVPFPAAERGEELGDEELEPGKVFEGAPREDEPRQAG